MVRRFSLSVFIVGFALAVAPVRAMAAGSTADLLELIGFDSFVESLSAAFTSADNELAQSGDGLGSAWGSAASQIFPADDILADIVDQMDGELSSEEIVGMTAFFESALGQEVTRMEVAAQSPAEAHLVDEEGAKLLARLIESDPDRLDRYTALVDALGIIEAQVASAMNINFAIMSGMSASGKLPYEMSEAEILGLIASQQDVLRGDIQNNVFLTFVYTYRDLSDPSLDRYIAFLTSDLGRALYGSINRATETVLSTRARKFGSRLMELQGSREL